MQKAESQDGMGCVCLTNTHPNNVGTQPRVKMRAKSLGAGWDEPGRQGPRVYPEPGGTPPLQTPFFPTLRTWKGFPVSPSKGFPPPFWLMPALLPPLPPRRLLRRPLLPLPVETLGADWLAGAPRVTHTSWVGNSHARDGRGGGVTSGGGVPRARSHGKRSPRQGTSGDLSF